MSDPDRNIQASVCHSTPNKIQSISSEIDSCMTTTELNRNNNFAEQTFNVNKDIETLRALVADSLVMGDSVFGKAGVSEISKQVKERNNKLLLKKENLKKEIDKNEAIIERSNRDFTDVKERIPDPQPKRILNVLEDYTLALLVISYLFMIMSVIYIYTLMSPIKLLGFFKAMIGSIFITIFLFMILYYFT